MTERKWQKALQICTLCVILLGAVEIYLNIYGTCAEPVSVIFTTGGVRGWSASSGVQ